MSEEFQQAQKLEGFEASIQEKQLYSIKRAVMSLIEFVTTSLEQLGIDKLHELVDPSLDELHEIILQLDAEAKQHGDLNLNQVLLIAQMLINDIKQKNPEMCAQSSQMLRSARIL
ncbi:hypothetical protein [Serratia ficaria]|uniref:hypothetical protein n=1 Tax=Serratia ficaria TaxID=61651 RepID=UPI002183D4FC|nr:hypothetical protein [Serratia ficaria]CAI2535450.1 Uncharacterised protein [Serratia ficaria]